MGSRAPASPPVTTEARNASPNPRAPALGSSVFAAAASWVSFPSASSAQPGGSGRPYIRRLSTRPHEDAAHAMSRMTAGPVREGTLQAMAGFATAGVRLPYAATVAGPVL